VGVKSKITLFPGGLEFSKRAKVDIESYDEVLDFLDDYFTARVKDEFYLQELKELVDGSRRNRTVTIRPIQLLFLEYRRKFNDYSVVIEGEEKIWMNLLSYWQ